MASLTVHYDCPSEDMDDIMEMAGYGIGYWATSAEIGSDADGEWTYTVTPDDDAYPLAIVLTRHDYAEAMVWAAGDAPIRAALSDACRAAVFTGDLSDVDADAADVLTQRAAFGEVVYG